MIEEQYLLKLKQCEKRIEELTDWEQGFILGDPSDDRKPALKNRSFLSTKQKARIDQIVVTRLEGGKWDKHYVQLEHGRVNATKTEEGWKMTVDGIIIGSGLVKAEAGVISSWLCNALDDLEQFFNSTERRTETPQEELDQVLEKESEPEQETQIEEIEEDEPPF